MSAGKLVLGTAQFGSNYGINNTKGKLSYDEIAEILDTAYANGVRFLDTAETYGDSQELIGRYHKSSSNKFSVITKYSDKKINKVSNIADRIIKNIQSLNVDYLYAYLFHSFNEFEKHYKESIEDIYDLKKVGLLKKFGISVYTNDELIRTLDYDGVDIIQLPFNLLDNNNCRMEVLRKAEENQIEIHVRSIFLQGLFFKNVSELSEVFDPIKHNLDQLKCVVDRSKITMEHLAVGYVNSQKNIHKILIGVDSVGQLKQNLLALNGTIDEGVLAQVDEIFVNDVRLLNPSNWL